MKNINRQILLLRQRLNDRNVFLSMMTGMLFLLLYAFILHTDFRSDKVSLEEGDVCERDVVSPRTVSYVNIAKTQKLKDEVLAGVAVVHDINPEVLNTAEDKLKKIFETLRENSAAADSEIRRDELRQQRREQLLTADGDRLLNPEAADVLLAMSPEELEQVSSKTAEMLRRLLQKGVDKDELELVQKHLVMEIAESEQSDNAKYLERLLVSGLLTPNMAVNSKETEKRRQASLSAVEPVREVMREGQVIVRRGDVVSAQQLAVMTELGISRVSAGWQYILGLLLYILLIMLAVGGFLYHFERKNYQRFADWLLVALIVLLTLTLGKLTHYYSYFAAPLAVGSLLGAILLGTRTGMVLGIGIAMLYGAAVEYDLRVVIAALLSSTISVCGVSRLAHGCSLTRTGMLLALVNVLTIGTTGVMIGAPAAKIFAECTAGLLSGIASVVIATGILPYVENAFGITSSIKLLNLGQPNHPLLQRLMLEAPGTYNHSVLIGNLAETAADVIGADTLVTRIGAYYHDIGKTRRPYFFVENQFGGGNPHDRLTPDMSSQIITAHVRDGLELCKKYDIPQVICDIVEQHHGTLLVGYFYNMALKNAPDGKVNETDYRYDGPVPHSREAALIMIADACEAAVRSLKEPDSRRIETLVRKIIRERLNDAQFDECDITMKELSQIAEVYTRILAGMFHSRIEYPDTIKKFETANKSISSGESDSQ